jgi:hypothetical protein
MGENVRSEADVEDQERAWESTKLILCICKAFILLQSFALCNIVEHLLSFISSNLWRLTIDRVGLQDAIRQLGRVALPAWFQDADAGVSDSVFCDQRQWCDTTQSTLANFY